MDYTNKTIIWTVPKYIQALCTGATSFKDVLVEAGVNLYKLSVEEMASRRYVFSNDFDVITMKVPIGAEGGYYKVSWLYWMAGKFSVVTVWWWCVVFSWGGIIFHSGHYKGGEKVGEEERREGEGEGKENVYQTSQKTLTKGLF